MGQNKVCVQEIYSSVNSEHVKMIQDEQISLGEGTQLN